MRRTVRMTKNLRIKWIRGQILQFIKLNSPASVNAEMVWRMLDLSNYSITDSELLQHLDYLQQKGYLKIQAERLSPDELAKVMLSLTAAGTDLLSGFLEDDPGIEVG